MKFLIIILFNIVSCIWSYQILNHTITLSSNSTEIIYLDSNLTMCIQYCKYNLLIDNDCINYTNLTDEKSGSCDDIMINKTYIIIESPDIVEICNFTYTVLLDNECNRDNSNNQLGTVGFVVIFIVILVAIGLTIIFVMFLIAHYSPGENISNTTIDNVT